jgi:hypothetical protein
MSRGEIMTTRRDGNDALDILLADTEAASAAAAALDANTTTLYARPNVIGLSVGARQRRGALEREIGIKVYVTRKVPLDMLAPEARIPEFVEHEGRRVPVDVEESTIPTSTIYTARNRPLRGGSSISPVFGGAGTLGCCVTLDDKQTYILSCNHIIAFCDGLVPGSRILQPALEDGGVPPTDEIASLHSAVPLDFGTTTVNIFGASIQVQNPNYVDCALARVDPNAFTNGDRRVHWLGFPSLGPRPTAGTLFDLFWPLGRRVHLMGRTSEYMVGYVESVWEDRIVTFKTLFGPKKIRFVAQMRISVPARDGDSGALVLDADSNVPIGLLWGGNNDTFGLATPIDRVLKALKIPRI